MGGRDGLTNTVADVLTPAFLNRWTENHVAILLQFSDLVTSEEYYHPFTVHQLGTTESMRKEVCFLERYNSDKRYKESRRKRLCGRQLSVFLVLVCGHFRY